MESLSKLLGGNSKNDIFDMYNMITSSPEVQNEVMNLICSLTRPASPPGSYSEKVQPETRTSVPEHDEEPRVSVSPKITEYSATFSQVLEYIKTLESKEASWKGVVKQIQLENTDLRKKISELETQITSSQENDQRLRAVEQENEKLRNALEVLMARF